jgi:hypothetical protein
MPAVLLQGDALTGVIAARRLLADADVLRRSVASVSQGSSREADCGL